MVGGFFRAEPESLGFLGHRLLLDLLAVDFGVDVLHVIEELLSARELEVTRLDADLAFGDQAPQKLDDLLQSFPAEADRLLHVEIDPLPTQDPNGQIPACDVNFFMRATNPYAVRVVVNENPGFGRQRAGLPGSIGSSAGSWVQSISNL